MDTVFCQFMVQSIIVSCLWTSSRAEPIFGKDVLPVEQPSEYPHIVMVTDSTRTRRCTGIVVSPRHVLTAARCLLDDRSITLSWHELDGLATSVHVVTGPTDRSRSQRSFQAKSMTTYNSWSAARKLPDSVRLCNDIAIIELYASEIGIVPATIAYTEDTQWVGSEVTLTGWGATRAETSPRVPHKAQVTILSKSACEARVNEHKPQPTAAADASIPFHLGKEVLCLASPNANSVVASVADYGGPVFDKYGRVVGITSARCPQTVHNWLSESQVNLALRLSHYREFIRDAIVDNDVLGS